MQVEITNFKKAVQRHQSDLVKFAQKLIQTPSLPGEEETIAQFIQAEMNALNYDDIQVDAYGNVIGHIKGLGGPSIMLNGHMDHVDPGATEGWPYPPFSGQVVDGILWGRGAVDMKGPVACMMYAPAVIHSLNLTPPGDVYVVVPVMEEVGGIGSSYLAQNLKTDVAIVGEPSHNTLRRGHRGRVEMWVTFTGKSIHASIPQQGINPHYSVANFLQHLRQLDMVSDETFGPSSVAPTLYHSDQAISPNVTPGQIRLTLDWRNIPRETPTEIVQRVTDLLQKTLLDGCTGQVELATRSFTTYTDITLEHSAVFPSFALSADDKLVLKGQQALNYALEREVPIDIWYFATDGGHLMANNIPTLGFGPGDETLAHTNREHIAISDLVEALAGYTALALNDWV